MPKCKLILEYWGGSVSKDIGVPLPIGAEISYTNNKGKLITFGRVETVDYEIDQDRIKCIAQFLDLVDWVSSEKILKAHGWV
jgi:hypothetical protein